MKEKPLRTKIEFLRRRQNALAKEACLTTNISVADYCKNRVRELDREIKWLQKDLELQIENEPK